MLTKKTTVEEVLAKIWSKLLGIPENVINEASNFFGLGGDSKLAVELISQIRKYTNRQNILTFYTVYKAPTVGDLADTICEVLKTDEICKKLETVSKLNPFPLSFAQEQLWLHQEENHSASNWNVVRLLRFEDPINLDALEKTINVIIEANESLRITVMTSGHRPWQKISPYRPITVNQLKTSNVVTAAHNLWDETIDLSKGILISFHILKNFDTDKEISQNLIVCYHHILMDGHGWTEFVENLNQVYYKNLHITNSQILLAQPVSFPAAIKWEKQQKEKLTKLDKSLVYWKTSLEDMKPIFFNIPAHLEKTSVGKVNILHTIQFSSVLTEKLILLAKAENVTLYTLMLGVFKILTFRYTKVPDQTIITLFRSGTSIEGSQCLMSHFVNMLPIRTVLNEIQDFRAALAQIRTSLSSGLEHSHIPYQDMMNELPFVNRELKKQLLKIMFQMRPLTNSPLTEFKEIHLEEQGFGVVDLGIDIDRSNPNGLICSIEYNPQVFLQTFIQRFGTHYEQLCLSIINCPDEPIKSLNILPIDEQQRILDKYSSSGSLKLSRKNFVQLFQKQVKLHPIQICMKTKSEMLTYGEVDETSDILASNIQKLIEFDEKFVAVLLPQSTDFILSTIAILKCQKIVCPISLSHPEHYVTSMLADLKNPIVLTNRANFHLVSSYYNRVAVVEDILGTFNQYYERKFESNSHQVLSDEEILDDVAYTFFTSGTTGVPKGVLVKQESLLNVVWTYVTNMYLGVNDRSMFFHNPGFDASIVDYWPSLISGGTIYIPDESYMFDPTELWTYIVINKITFANIPTAIAKSIFSNFHLFDKTNLAQLRWLALGGEALKVAPPTDFPAKVLNAYGPTETTVDATHVIATEKTILLNSIGRPLPNSKVYILDENMNPVPIGVEGILWIGGRGVAAGYLNRQILSKKVFVSNPYELGDKLYCSGDVAKWLDNGEISILGRVDEQVKVNGFRLELEGIEAAMLSHPNIKDAAIITVPSLNTTILVGFCVVNIEMKYPSDEELTMFLKTRLPYYAIPKKFCWIDSIPVITNQKVDRKSLTRLYSTQISKVNNHIVQSEVCQFTKTEELIARVWSRLFNIDLHSLHKSTTFYEVGGSSIMVGNLIREINIALELTNGGKPLALHFKDIFDHSCIESMAKLVDMKQQEVDRHKNCLTSYQRYIWFHQQFLLGPESLMYIRHRVFKVDTQDIEFIRRRLISILKKFETTLTVLFQVVRGHLQVKQTSWSVFEKSQILQKQLNVNFKTYLLDEISQPFDLSDGRLPMFRSQLVQSGTSTYLCFFWHHIILPYERYVSLFSEIFKIKHLLSFYLSNPESIAQPNDAKVQNNLTLGFNVQVMRQPVHGSNDGLTFLQNILNELNLDLSETVILHLNGPNTSLISSSKLLSIKNDVQFCNTIFMDSLQESLDEVDIFQLTATTCRIMLRVINETDIITIPTELTSPLVLSSTQAFLSADFDLYIKVFSNEFLEIEFNALKYKFCPIQQKLKRLAKHQQQLTNKNNSVTKCLPMIKTNAWMNLAAKLWSLSLEIPLREVLRTSHQPFLKLGGTSDKFLQLSSTLLSLLAPQYVSLKYFHDNSSLEAMVQMLSNLEPYPNAGPDSLVPVIFDTEVSNLVENLRPSQGMIPYKNKKTEKVVLVTGSTGCFGAFLIEELMNDSSVGIIYCLFRGDSEKLQKNLTKYKIPLDNSSKLVPIVGDLTLDYFGLDGKKYFQLCEDIDLIIHCGAYVNLLQPYSVLRCTNVLGTKEICQFALNIKAKAIHYISTTETGVGQFLFETSPQILEEKIAPPPYFDMGYCQTKWVAECLVYHTSQFVPAKIYRTGTFGVHSTRSIPLNGSFDGGILSACNILGVYPAAHGLTVPYSDVDFLAQTITTLALSNELNINGNENVILNIVQENYTLPEVMMKLPTEIFPEISSVWYYDKFKTYCGQQNNEELTNLLLVLEQRPWGNLSKLKNLFDFSDRSPFIAYPMNTCVSLCKILNADYTVPKSSIVSYLNYSCGI